MCLFQSNLRPCKLSKFNRSHKNQTAVATSPQHGLIFKSGDLSDPNNYRGICVSSCLGKFFTLILNHRLLLYIEKHQILHNSQIGFLSHNRTSDYIFTLRTIVDKYVLNRSGGRVYACFIDLKRPSIQFGTMVYCIGCSKIISVAAFMLLLKIFIPNLTASSNWAQTKKLFSIHEESDRAAS